MTGEPTPPDGEPDTQKGPESEPAPAAPPPGSAVAQPKIPEHVGETPAGPSGKESRIALWVAVVAALVGIPGAVAGFYFLLDPGPTPCSGTRSATLGQPTLDSGRTYREFLRVTHQSAGGTDKPTLDQVGTIITVPFTAEGYKGKDLPLRWTMLTEGGGTISEPGFDDLLAFTVTPEACTDGGPRKLWTPWPRPRARPEDNRYLVELMLLDDHDEMIATLRTPVFAVSRRRARRGRGRARAFQITNSDGGG